MSYNFKDYGSLQNAMFATSQFGTPIVGNRATIALWTDRFVVDVVWVSDNFRKCLIRRTEACAKSTASGFGHQDWDIISHEEWTLDTIVLYRGAWYYEDDTEDPKKKKRGCKVAIKFNLEAYYYDWSF
jgi:hypothetical protein